MYAEQEAARWMNFTKGWGRLIAISAAGDDSLLAQRSLQACAILAASIRRATSPAERAEVERFVDLMVTTAEETRLLYLTVVSMMLACGDIIDMESGRGASMSG